MNVKATSEQGYACSDFLFVQKISHTLHCSSAFAKKYVCVGYSLASALITPLAHYHLFASCACGAYVSFLVVLFKSGRALLCSDFLCKHKKSVARAAAPPLSQKRHGKSLGSFVNALAVALLPITFLQVRLRRWYLFW